MWLWKELANKYLLSIGITPPEDLRESLKELSLLEACNYMKDRFKIQKTAKKINSEMEDILSNYYAKEFQLKPYVLDTLRKLKEKNIRMCLATATEDRLVLLALDRLEIRDYFEFIQTCNNTGLGKWQKEFFQLAIDRLQIDPEDIWVFEDALHCIISAKKCGLNVVGIYDDSAIEDMDSIKELVDIYIKDFSQLEVESL
nr:HAD family hydrolase [Wansuia hejianensis]